MRLSCDIIKDLLPLYQDEICSEDTKKLVEEHLHTCEECRNTANKMGMEFHIPPKELDETTFIRNINQKLTNKEIRFTIISVIFLVLASIGIYFAQTYRFIPIPSSSFRISEVSCLEDNTIGFFLEITDGKDLYSMIVESPDENGIVYITGKRSLFETWASPSELYGYHEDYFFHNLYRRYDHKTHEFYYDDTPSATEIRFGTEDDYIVIWKEGMELPAASDEMEKDWARYVR